MSLGHAKSAGGQKWDISNDMEHWSKILDDMVGNEFSMTYVSRNSKESISNQISSEKTTGLPILEIKDIQFRNFAFSFNKLLDVILNKDWTKICLYIFGWIEKSNKKDATAVVSHECINKISAMLSNIFDFVSDERFIKNLTLLQKHNKTLDIIRNTCSEAKYVFDTAIEGKRFIYKISGQGTDKKIIDEIPEDIELRSAPLLRCFKCIMDQFNVLLKLKTLKRRNEEVEKLKICLQQYMEHMPVYKRDVDKDCNFVNNVTPPEVLSRKDETIGASILKSNAVASQNKDNKKVQIGNAYHRFDLYKYYYFDVVKESEYIESMDVTPEDFKMCNAMYRAIDEDVYNKKCDLAIKRGKKLPKPPPTLPKNESNTQLKIGTTAELTKEFGPKTVISLTSPPESE